MKMLKAALVAAFMMICSIAVCKDNNFQIGPKAGMNIYYLIKPADGFSSNFAVGFHAGIITSFNLGDSSNYSIRPEFLFSKTGADVEETTYANYTNLNLAHTTSVHLKYSMRFNSIHIPVLLNYQFAGGMSIAIGPYFSYLLSAKSDSSIFISFKDSSNIPTNIAKASSGGGTQDIINTMNKTDIGAAIGLNYETAGGFGFQFRYSYGFTNAFKGSQVVNPNTKISSTQAAYGNNTNISISLFYLF